MTILLSSSCILLAAMALRRAREELDSLKHELEEQRDLAGRLQEAEHAATVAEERELLEQKRV